MTSSGWDQFVLPSGIDCEPGQPSYLEGVQTSHRRQSSRRGRGEHGVKQTLSWTCLVITIICEHPLKTEELMIGHQTVIDFLAEALCRLLPLGQYSSGSSRGSVFLFASVAAKLRQGKFPDLREILRFFHFARWRGSSSVSPWGSATPRATIRSVRLSSSFAHFGDFHARKKVGFLARIG